ncbi:MAG: TetR family transcriptional regulator [Actinomycetota bacterium]
MSTTADRIADAALRLFNRKGYSATTLTEIATEVGISQGNLTYHFPTKLDLALHLSETVRERTERRRAQLVPGDIADDYVESLIFAMEMSADYGFLMRDQGIFEPAAAVVPPSPIMTASFDERRTLIGRIHDAGLFRAEADVDPDMLARSLWILSRHWMEHLREMEQRETLGADAVVRGVEHHFAILLPTLTATGRRRFRSALARARPANAQPNRSASTS